MREKEDGFMYFPRASWKVNSFVKDLNLIPRVHFNDDNSYTRGVYFERIVVADIDIYNYLKQQLKIIVWSEMYEVMWET